jgi:hypothetical protein
LQSRPISQLFAGIRNHFNELDQLKEDLEIERGFALYCKVIPHAVFGELAMYNHQQFEYEKNYSESTANDHDSSSDYGLEEDAQA